MGSKTKCSCVQTVDPNGNCDCPNIKIKVDKNK